MMPNKKRDDYVDIAKGLCIILIVVIHSEVMGYLGMVKYTYFAVPLFFYMSGFYDKSELSWKDVVRKTLLTVLTPAIFWLSIGIVYKGLLSFCKSGALGVHIDLYGPTLDNGPIWFLFALFVAKLLTLLLTKCRIPFILQLIISIGIGLVGMKTNLPIHLDEGMSATPLYLLGKYSYEHIKLIINNKWLIALGTISLLLFYGDLLTYTIVPKMNYSLMATLFVSFFAIISFVPILWTCSRLDKTRWLQKVGKQSLGIMLTHALLCHTFAVIINRLFNIGSIPWIIVSLFSFIAVCIISYYLSLLISKYCPILLGKRHAQKKQLQ